MATTESARSREQRKQDVLGRLSQDDDIWVATASADGEPYLVPLSFVWDRDTLLMCTRRTNPTARNLTPAGEVRVTLGHTRDVVHIEGTAEPVEGTESWRRNRPMPSPRSSTAGTRATGSPGSTSASHHAP